MERLDGGGPEMTLQERIDGHAEQFPPTLHIDPGGRIYGIWVAGQDYRNKSDRSVQMTRTYVTLKRRSRYMCEICAEKPGELVLTKETL